MLSALLGAFSAELCSLIVVASQGVQIEQKPHLGIYFG